MRTLSTTDLSRATGGFGFRRPVRQAQPAQAAQPAQPLTASQVDDMFAKLDQQADSLGGGSTTSKTVTV